MKDRKKRKQREEVRKILHAMRLELAAQRLAQEKGPERGVVLKLNDLFQYARETNS